MSSPTVHWTQPGIEALPETDGHGDTCGPIVILDYRHLAHGVPLDLVTLDAERQELINWGLMGAGSGMTMGSVGRALREHYGCKTLKEVDYESNPGNFDWNTFHNDLKTAMANHQMVMMETSNAAAFPGNQPGVQFHFVLFAGWDSQKGYYYCNGDLMAMLQFKTPQPPVWVDAQSIMNSRPCGYIVMESLDPVAPPPPQGGTMLTVERDASGGIVGAHDASGKHILGGFAAEAVAKGWDKDHDIEIPEEDVPGLPAFCMLRTTAAPDVLMTYKFGEGVLVYQGTSLCQIFEHYYNQPAPTVPDVKSDLAAIDNAVKDLHTKLGE